MALHRLDQIFAVLMLGFGLFVVWTGTNYGYMSRNAPGAGFFPIWAGVFMMVTSLMILLRTVVKSSSSSSSSAQDSGDDEIDRQEIVTLDQVVPVLGLLGAVALYLIAAPYLGMLLPLPILVLLSAFSIRRQWDRPMTLRIVLIAALLPVACYFVFGVFLGVRLLTGPFGF